MKRNISTNQFKLPVEETNDIPPEEEANDPDLGEVVARGRPPKDENEEFNDPDVAEFKDIIRPKMKRHYDSVIRAIRRKQGDEDNDEDLGEDLEPDEDDHIDDFEDLLDAEEEF